MSARRSVIPVFIPHAGCPHDCVFCNQCAIANQSAPPEPSEVAEFVERALERAGEGAELAFYGGSFTALPVDRQEAFLSAVAPLLRSGALSSIRLSTRPDAVNGEILSLLGAYGVKTIELGAQSMKDGVLFSCRRGHTADDTKQSAARIRKAGFKLGLQMMVGLPGDTDEGALATAEELISCGPDFMRVYPALVLPGTALAELWRRGEYEALTLERAVSVCARILAHFASTGIPVIRTGLQPTEELGSAFLAGPYHPAFGELVKARVMRNKMEALLEGEAGSLIGRDALFAVHPAELSQALGHKRENSAYLTSKYALHSLRLRPDSSLERGEPVLSSDFFAKLAHT